MTPVIRPERRGPVSAGHVDLPGSDGLRLEMLGPARAWNDGEGIALGPARQQAICGILAMRAGVTVSRDELVDGVWGDEPPASATGSVHIYVAGLRRVLEPGRAHRAPGKLLITMPSGYTLRLPRDRLDAEIFVSRVNDAQRARDSGDAAKAAGLLDGALSLWRGTAFAGIPGPFADRQRSRLSELRQQAVEDAAEIRISLGQHAMLVTELTVLARQYPLRERLRSLLILALYRSGRQADALEEFRLIRTDLVEELGIEPGNDLQQLNCRILSSDPALSPPPERCVSPAPAACASQPATDPPVPAQIPNCTRRFVARKAELQQLYRLLPNADMEGLPSIAMIDGVAGSGKTALAIHFAHQVKARFPDGQLYVDLNGFGPEPPRDPARVLAQMLRGLGVSRREPPTELDELSALLRSHLAGRRLLLILDNASDSQQVVPLLPGDGPSMVVATSRNRLTGLVTRHGAERITLNVLRPDESVTLLDHVLGHRRVSSEVAAARKLAELCSHLPLALRIAADRLAANPRLPLAVLTREMEVETARLDALSLTEEESTAVRDVFSWSYRALRPRAARVFRLLGLHDGPEFSGSSAAALAGEEPAAIRPLLRALCSVHLLQEIGEDRYRAHDLLRVYGRECAHAQEDWATRRRAVRRMLQWYLHSAERAGRILNPHRHRPSLVPPGPGVLPVNLSSRDEALAWYEAEHINLVAAVDQAARHGEHSIAVHLTAIMCDHLLERRPWAPEWIRMHEVAMASAAWILKTDRGSAGKMCPQFPECLLRELAGTVTASHREEGGHLLVPAATDCDQRLKVLGAAEDLAVGTVVGATGLSKLVQQPGSPAKQPAELSER